MKILYLSLLIVLSDQCSKFFVKGINIPALDLDLSGLMYGVRYNVLGSFVNFTFVENPGIAFGIELTSLLKVLLSVSSGLIASSLIIYLYTQRNEKILFRISLALIIGGAFGNFIDRVFYGYLYGYAPLLHGKVVDFIEVKFFTISLFGYTFDHLPIFNIADLAVASGVTLILFFQKRLLSGNAENNFVIEQDAKMETAE